MQSKLRELKQNIDVIIPVLNEQDSIGKVLDEIPQDLVRNVIVCNNGSTDDTEKIARSKGVVVVNQPTKGYGNACLKGMDYIKTLDRKPDVIVFLDGDYSDFPSEMTDLIQKMNEQDLDLVIGSRSMGKLENGAMMPQQIFGNWLATTPLKIMYKYDFTDLGPFRAIKYQSLLDMDMEDKTFGWTIEMQVKAAKMRLKVAEIPVKYRKRIGKSKVSGTIKGSVLAGYKILWTLFKYIR